jgi:membrane-associated phospholipid phosphatase
MTWWIRFLFFVAFGFSVLQASGQNDSIRHKSDLLRFGEGLAYTYTGPFRWERKQWIQAGAVFAGTAAFMLADEPARDFWQKRDSKFWDGVEYVGFHYGKPYTGFTTSGVLYLSGIIFKDEWMRDSGIAIGITMLSSGAVQTFLKSAVGRSRPEAERGSFTFDPFTSDISYHAFPGGHITVATAVSYVLARRTKSTVGRVLFYSLAASTIVSRLYSDSHWVSDEIFGAAMTIAFAEGAVQYIARNKREYRTRNKTAIRFSPGIMGGAVALKF